STEVCETVIKSVVILSEAKDLRTNPHRPNNPSARTTPTLTDVQIQSRRLSRRRLRRHCKLRCHTARKNRLLRLKTRMKRRQQKPPAAFHASKRPHERRGEQRLLHNSFSA